MANFTWVSGFPGAAPNLNSESVAILSQEHSGWMQSGDFQSVFCGEAFSVWLNAEYVEVVSQW